MSQPIYTFSLLQYHHSQVLGEVLNIGALVYFPNVKRLECLFPKKLSRLKFTYPSVPERTIKSYFRAFEEKVTNLNLRPELFTDLELDNSFKKFLAQEFLPEDSSSLQFGEIKKGIQFSNDYQVICNQLYNLYFSVFEHNINNYNRIDETTLLNIYKNLIKDLGKEIYNKGNKRLHFDYEIEPREGDVFKFDIAWQNGSLNLVKPISFDVFRAETIQSKSYKYYGQFIELQDFADKHKLRFDLLIARPKKRELFKSFENALELLSRPKHVKIVEQDDFEEYSKQTINGISLFEN